MSFLAMMARLYADDFSPFIITAMGANVVG
jgi:hypothetical protein